MAHLYRINWRRHAAQPTHFCYVEADQPTIAALTDALKNGLVICYELYFNRDDPDRWRLTKKAQCALRYDDVLSIKPAPDHVIRAVQRVAA